ncbi:uncharacterized protein LAJ45_02588 [Morchella importuna]|uniref:uncharacterized protein n=1 Tax=Morchella importuna TaxID=1174673 RepID=UPI001E8D7957|nr:uncharacterized protein LAJ45_02588 [Morchella importuna]KAH8153001.1 hypothetical protein LAJ45_02588 [Morchella importuna]
MFEMTKNQDKTSEKLHRLQHQLTNLSTNRPNNQVAAEGRAAVIAAAAIAAAIAAATTTAAPTTPASNPNHAQQPRGKAKETPTPAAPRSYASIAAGNNNPEFTTVTNKRKTKPKVDPLFKPEIIRLNRKITPTPN